ncbi:peptidoglycan-binding domain-containing protein [Streptomyces sp. NPDC002928]|uniref:peptidoglycan-binding domain-containing protein n=1 Tax=Streptomyces sp. NPDC002928 TaxID=3154440 RepID=UPI0033B8484C
MGRDEHVDERGAEGGAGDGADPNGGGRGHQCPECGALRGPDNTPSCACTQRASDALRDARTAEAAAAEDFDPLRIRPYVELEGAGLAGTGRRSAEPTTEPPTEPPTADVTMPLRRIEAASVLPTPLAPPPGEPSAGDLSLFEGADRDPYADPLDAPEPPRRRHRRRVLLGAAGAVVAVVAAAGFAGGLFSYETPSRNTAAPEDVRAAVPGTSTSAASEPSATAASASAGPTSESPSPSPSRSESPSPSPSRSSASPSPSASTEPTGTATSAGATASLATGNGGQSTGPVLRVGDKGPEVTELQQRLHQLYLYNDEIDGKFSGRVQDALRNYQWSRGVGTDDLGVYGAATRAKLEAETTEP